MLRGRGWLHTGEGPATCSGAGQRTDYAGRGVSFGFGVTPPFGTRARPRKTAVLRCLGQVGRNRLCCAPLPGAGLGWFPACAQAEQWGCGLRPGEEGLVPRAATWGSVWATSPRCVCRAGLLHSWWAPRKAAECCQGGVCGAPEQRVCGGGCQHVYAHVSVHVCVCVCAYGAGAVCAVR